MPIPIYLQSDIVLLIVDYLLIDKRYGGGSGSSNQYSLKRFATNSNELVILSTVSKKYHSLIINIIKNNLINNKSLHNWIVNHNVKPYVIYSTEIRYPKTYIRKIQINQPMSLIKIEDKEIEYYFNNKLKVVQDKVIGDEQDQYENIIINFGIDSFLGGDRLVDIETAEFLLNGLPDNIKDKTNVNIRSLELGFDNLQSQQFSNGLKSTNYYNIDKLVIYDIGSYLVESNQQLLSSNVNILNPKQLKLYPNYNDGNHNGYEWIFKIPNIESIKIDDSDYIDCKNFNGLSTTSISKLSSLSVYIVFHDIIKLLRGEPVQGDCSYFSDENYDTSTIEEMTNYWNVMISSLSNNQSIKCLKIKNFCRKGKECYKLKNRPCPFHKANFNNPNFCQLGNGTDCFQQRRKRQIKQDTNAINLLNNGFKLLFTSNSTIEYFKFKNIEFLNKSSLSGLIDNKSIKELYFKNTCSENDNFDNLLDYLVSDILTVNKTILHLSIIHQSNFNIFKLLLSNQLNLNLVSVKLPFNQLHINDILELISSVYITIKEIHLICKETEYQSISNSINECNKTSNNPKLIYIKVVQ